MLKEIRHGTINIIFSTTKEKYQFGGVLPLAKNDSRSVYQHLKTTLIIHQNQFWRRIFLAGDMGFAEAYMDGEIDVSDMMSFLIIMVINKRYLKLTNYSGPLSWISQTIDKWHHSKLANSISNSIFNISAHYDLSNLIFSKFLDKKMQYSSADWEYQAENETLENAQDRKIERILNAAHVRQGTRVLEIGSGWGSLAIEAAKRGATVISITLSNEQWRYANEKVREAESKEEIKKGRIRIELMDYRDLPINYQEGYFDSIISIEMIEAVGKEYLTLYFDVCHRMLHPYHGILVIQAITITENRYEEYASRCDFIQKHIFPGGHLPSLSKIISSAAPRLSLVESKGMAENYVFTLQAWKMQFLKNFKEISDSFKITSTPSKSEFEIEKFKRKFLYYFDYCSAGFATRMIDVHHLVFSREGNERLFMGSIQFGSLLSPLNPLMQDLSRWNEQIVATAAENYDNMTSETIQDSILD